jgi:DNA-nicking Smr family endonuclease
VKRPPTRHGLQDLQRLHEAHRQQERERARREAAARELQLAAERERLLFRHAVGPVEPLRRIARERPRRPKPEPVARQRALDEAQALRETWSDGMDSDTLLDTDEALSWRRPGIGQDVLHKLRRGIWATQGQCDLHGLRRDEARDRLGDFLRDAGRQGLRCVRVIHGKGNGSPGRAPVLKGKVRHWLVQKAEVLAFVQARASDGGHGAVLVLLQPTAPPARDQAPPLLRIQSAVPKKA